MWSEWSGGEISGGVFKGEKCLRPVNVFYLLLHLSWITAGVPDTECSCEPSRTPADPQLALLDVLTNPLLKALECAQFTCSHPLHPRWCVCHWVLPGAF